MKKIVILSDQIENNNLVLLLNALFPECEICVAHSKQDYFERHSYGSLSENIGNSERRIHHGKKS